MKVKRQALRLAVTLAGEAEARILAAGGQLPQRADLIVWLLPAAAQAVTAGRAHQQAARLHEVAARQAAESEQAAAAAVAAVIAQCAARSPASAAEAAPARRLVDLDLSRWRVGLVLTDTAVAQPAGEASC
jgi:hypothetical protein